MTLEFSEKEMIDFLLMYGHIIYRHIEEKEVNIYQNKFETIQVEIIEAIKGGKTLPLKEAFKKQLLNQI